MSCENMWNVSLSGLSLEDNDKRKEKYKMEQLYIKILMEIRETMPMTQHLKSLKETHSYIHGETQRKEEIRGGLWTNKSGRIERIGNNTRNHAL